MTARKPSRPPRPLKLLRALFDAQREALEVPATTSTHKVDRDRVETTTSYAGSEDSLRVARGVLHRNGLMATPAGSEALPAREDGRLVLRVTVLLLHVDCGQELRSTFDVEVSSQWGSNAATTSGYATALRLLLGLPREAERTTIAAPEPPPDEPRETHRVVIPAPRLAERVAEKLPPPPPTDIGLLIETGDREELQGVCARLSMELATREGAKDPQAWRHAAGVPTEGRLDVEHLQRYARWLRHELDPPHDSGAAWPSEAS